MLLILVVVAGVGLAAILGWMGKIGGGPDTVESTLFYHQNQRVQQIEAYGAMDDFAEAPSSNFVVEVLDTDGNGVTNAVVTLTGAVEQSVVETTDASEGKATFANVNFRLPPQKMTGQVTVKVEKTDWTPFETNLIVIRR